MSDSFIDEVMGFNPSNLDVFQEKQQVNYDVNIYKTNPIKLAKSDDGVYRSRIKIIYNPKNIKQSIVHQAFYAMTDQDGFFMVRSMIGDGNRACPLFRSWKQLWFSNDPAKKEWAKKMYEKNESNWVLIQVLEDENQPDLVGKFLFWKLPDAIRKILEAKMHPSEESKKLPVPVMDYLLGTALELTVEPGPDDPTNPQRKQREISYNLSEFEADPTPIIKVDGTPLFTDEEIEVIESFNTAKNDAYKAKTETKKANALKQVEGLTPEIKTLYKKAIEYLNDNLTLDLVKECGFIPWTEEETKRVDRWIKTVAAMKDPKVENDDEDNPLLNNVNNQNNSVGIENTPSSAPVIDPLTDVLNEDADGDLPF